MSCKLISEDMNLVIVNEEDMESTRNDLSKKLAAIKAQKSSGAEPEVKSFQRYDKICTY